MYDERQHLIVNISTISFDLEAKTVSWKL